MKPVYCDTCLHRRAPPGAPRLSGSAGSAQAFNVQSELRGIWKERGRSEDAEISEKKPIVTQPRTKAWCARSTLTPDEMDEVRRRFALQDTAFMESIKERRFIYSDAVQGVIRTIAVCDIKNIDRNCDDWEALS